MKNSRFILTDLMDKFLYFLTCLRMQHTLLEYNLENQQIQCHIYHTNLLKYCLCSWNICHQHHSSIVWSHEDCNSNLGRNIMYCKSRFPIITSLIIQKNINLQFSHLISTPAFSPDLQLLSSQIPPIS